jgi:hypothetical protein
MPTLSAKKSGRSTSLLNQPLLIFRKQTGTHLALTGLDTKRPTAEWFLSGKQKMNHLSDLQLVNSLVPPAGSQGEAALSNQTGGSEVFQKIFREIEMSLPISGTSRSEAGSTFLSVFAIERETVCESEHQKKESLADPSAEAVASLMPLDPALVLPAVNVPVQKGVVPEEPSSTPFIPLEGSALPDKERGIPIEANLMMPEGLPQMNLRGEKLTPSGLDGMEDPKAPSDPVEETIGVEKGSFPIDKGSSLPLERVDSEPGTASIERMLRQEKTKGAGRATPEGVVEKGPHSGETRFLTGHPVDEKQKKEAPPWVLSGSDQKGSEEAEARLDSERSTASNLFSNEMAGIIRGDAQLSGPYAGDRIEGDRLADATPLKVKTGAPLEGMSNEKALLHQIADKWASSHIKNGHSFRLQLEPEQLGALQIDIVVHQERIVAEIVTKHPFVKELLEGNQELLRGTLAEQGLKVDRFSVNIGDPGQSSLGWEHHLRQRGGGLLYESPDRSLPFGMEREERPLQPIWIKDRAKGAINLYV